MKMTEWALSTRHTKAADPKRCCALVHSQTGFGRTHQCSKSRGCGPEQAYCKIHDPAAVEKRDKESRDKFEMQLKEWRVKHAAPRLLSALKQIAEGHNDARGLAQEAIADLT